MALDFRVATVRFDPTSGRIQSEPGSAVFGSAVRKAEMAIRSFNYGYTDGDHHIWRTEVQLAGLRITGATVQFSVNLLIRDSSGNIDDRFDGYVEVLVIADVA